MVTFKFSWSFTVAPATIGPDPVVFLDGYPTGAVFTAGPKVGIGFDGPDPAVASVFVNGVEYPATIDDGNIFVAAGVLDLEVGSYAAYAVADGAMSAPWNFSVRAPYSGLDCFETCHTDIMDKHKFDDASGCEPCHGADSPWGGGYTKAEESIHGDKTCFIAGCHATLVDEALNPALLTTCGSCHPGDFHHADAHYGEGAGCAHCHSQGTADGKKLCLEACHRKHLPTFDHHIDLADSNDDSFYGASCNDGCHADNNVGPFGRPGGTYKCAYCHAPEENAALHHLATDVNDGCNDGCHAVNNVGPFGVVGGANACAVCHSAEPIDLHHALDGADQVASCNVCHYDVAAANQKAVKHADISSGTRGATCSDCHVIKSTVVGNALKGATGVSYVKDNLPEYGGRGVSVTPSNYATGTTHSVWMKPWDGALVDVTLDGSAKDYAEGEWMVCFKCHAGAGGNVGAWNTGTYTATSLGGGVNPGWLFPYGIWDGTLAMSSNTAWNANLNQRKQPLPESLAISEFAGTPASGSTGTWFATDLAREFNPNNPSGHRVVANPDGTVAGWGFVRDYNTGTTNPDGTTGVDKRLSNQAGVLNRVQINTPPAGSGNAAWLYNDHVANNLLGSSGLTKANLEARGAIFNLHENSVLKCTDCHTGTVAGAAGPHGSSGKFLLDDRWNARDWKNVTLHNMQQVSGPNAYICAKCHFMGDAAQITTVAPDTHSVLRGATVRGLALVHQYASATSGNGGHAANYAGYRCGGCHIAIPHGWKRPRLLVSTADDFGSPYMWDGATPFADRRRATDTRYGWGRMSHNLSKTTALGNWGSSNNCSQMCGTHGNLATSNYLP
jgi:hypothetical protein